MSSQGATPCWVWCPAPVAKDRPFKHPGEVPTNDDAAARACFDESLRGPRRARISPATILQSKGNIALIAEQGSSPREVPKFMVLPWYEGLLLLEELEAAKGAPGRIAASWWDNELRGVLEKERRKAQTGRLNSALYTEKRLLTVAVTGTKFVDGDEREWSYRRETLRTEDKSSLVKGEESSTFFRIKDIVGYLPPWEAFHHEKCGFYQDFYQVRWEYPYSEVDYSGVENGCPITKGSTWEPDECLPDHLDPLRLAAKRAWIRRKREQENLQKQLAEKPSAQGGALAANSPSAPAASTALKRERSEEAAPPPPPAKMAKTRRDGTALDRDLLHCRVGHDFAPEATDEQTTLGNLRSGWPKRPEDYPKGFAVAGPPGFCSAECDCMDDQRAQQKWETRKPWIDDVSRAQAAATTVQVFAGQSTFVRKRGQVSKMFFFETAQGLCLDQSHAQAAAELAKSTESAIKTVLEKIPASALAAGGDPVRIPARAFLKEDLDYEPMRFRATLAGSAPLPQWAQMDADSGQLVVAGQPKASDLPLHLRVELLHSEGQVASARCIVVADRSAAWLAQTVHIGSKLSDTAKCNLESGVRAAVLERCGEVFDFTRRLPRERTTLGTWLDVMGSMLRLLRSAAGASLAFGTTAALVRPTGPGPTGPTTTR